MNYEMGNKIYFDMEMFRTNIHSYKYLIPISTFLLIYMYIYHPLSRLT